ncbi:Hypothetical predicted protein [Olea europaea subsp. europaea]|uniref:Uncharacterized protein n=1 Tax=Olea europaea subsp. europaea TaxID=158383 RepID=A0A8S0U8G9_OLEEU|nr:Hypothetical predicted protein [Olea europaea subsp. europaea]
MMIHHGHRMLHLNHFCNYEGEGPNVGRCPSVGLGDNVDGDDPLTIEATDYVTMPKMKGVQKDHRGSDGGSYGTWGRGSNGPMTVGMVDDVKEGVPEVIEKEKSMSNMMKDVIFMWNGC